MINDSLTMISSLFQKMTGYLKKSFLSSNWKGFTLVETLCVVIIGGFCIFPIVNSLNHATTMTEGFSHKETLRMLARSRLNKSISVLSYEREPIDKERSFYYVYLDPAGDTHYTDSHEDPNTFLNNLVDTHDVQSITFSYKVEISYEESLPLKEDTAAPAVPDLYEQGAAGLRALVAKATYLSVDDPTTLAIEEDSLDDISVSLFSLITTPISHHHQRVIVSDPRQVSIYSLDTEFLNLVKVYHTYDSGDNLPNSTLAHVANNPWRPCHLAIHPSGNWLAVKLPTKIKMININEESADCGNQYEVFDISPNSFIENPLDSGMLKTDAQIVFRPDGKYLYASSHNPAMIYRWDVHPDLFKTADGLAPASLTNPVTVNLDGDDVYDMYAGEDGRLYVAQDKTVWWFSMYGEFSNMTRNKISTWNRSGENFSAPVRSVCTDRLGRRVLLAFDDTGSSPATETRFIWFNSNPYVPSPTTFTKYDLMNIPGNHQIRDMIVSPDNRYLGTAVYGEGLCYLTSNPPSAGTWEQADPCNGTHYETIVWNPNMLSFIVDQDVLGYVHMLDIESFVGGSLGLANMPTSTAIKFGDSTNNISDVAARAQEYLLVGCSDGTVHTVEYVDIQARHKLIKYIPLSSAPVNLAMNGIGDRVKVTSATGKETFNPYTTLAV